ncbi:MAG: nucleotidyl transferase AbiEii/AbiGii toxin family protein [Deltaproteobacteria bacterium]|nr:nucleotidyl transferase AbiEii/AbiGii toxin family protein [Deltaproteobacteria bacterium]
MKGALSPLQVRVLELLSPLTPRWALTGGGALAGFHLGHRTTRDLDLFWHGAHELLTKPHEVAELLREAGIGVENIVNAKSFCRMHVSSGNEVVVVDLVADPVAVIVPPQETKVGNAMILVDSAHEILVNKLCTLLSRSEVRDLMDIKALLAAEGDLKRAMGDAPKKDGGFSPLTLAWLLRDFPLRSLAKAEGLSEDVIQDLERFRSELSNQLAVDARP